MRLSEQTAPTRGRRERRGLGMLILALLALVSWGIYTGMPGRGPVASGRIACDAERVRGDKFVNGKHRFAGGRWQSRERARSGLSSCRLPDSGELQYALNYTLEGFRPGEAYRVQVWRHTDAVPSGKLVVQGASPSNLYHETGEASRRDDRGWECLEIFFFVPYRQTPTQINVYVYSDGLRPVFFDDLLIERVDYWTEQNFQPAVLKLEVGPTAWDKLTAKRNQALREGILQTDEDDWVNARFQADTSAEMDVKLRLKGDWLDHLQGDKWSFRVKTKPPQTWRRMPVFSLHSPVARHYLHEWALHQLWEREDVLTTRYDFVELELNGQNRGIYAYEEHFTKTLVESRRRREGPIVKLSEDGFWAGIGRQLNHHGFVWPGSGHSAMQPDHAPLAAFEEPRLAADSVYSAQYRQARLLLTQARNGARPASEIFDLTRLARYYASCDAMGAYHGVVWHNQRFYYNPLTSLLEPIGFDGFGGGDPQPYTFLGEGALNPGHLAETTLYGYLFQDTAFVRIYLGELYRLTSPAYWQAFTDSLQAHWEVRKQWLTLEFPEYQASLADLGRQAAYVHSLLLPYAHTSLRAYRLPGNRLLVENTHNLPIEVLGFGGSAQTMTQPLAQPRWLAARTPRYLLARLRRDSLVRDFGAIRFLEEEALARQAVLPQWDTLAVPAGTRYVFFQLPGAPGPTFATALHDWPLPEGLTARQKQLAGAGPGPDLPWLQARQGYWVVGPGRHRLSRTLVLPAGQRLLLEPGASIDLVHKAVIISYAPVQAFGSPDQPIEIFSSDGTGQGLQVLQAGEPSALKHVVFTGLTTLQGEWMLTGAVTFYESDVTFYRCVFRDNRSEDGLNVVRSRLELNQCRFLNTSSDAFDSDFSHGLIKDCFFSHCTNDGIDVSGSVFTIEGCAMEYCGDKGISVGEESDVTVLSAKVSHSNIGVASKDLSMLYIRNIELADCVQGFAAYQKKPEFGPARLLVESYRAQNVRRLHSIAQGSRLQLEQTLVVGE